ncbi:DUF4369 domain-containing protein [Lacibacter sp. H407]|uniref:DUF4369 domain-containing protein n=1 Tax=Lacibacter sp. H407 TaxID=3133423 RepID=UPI0030C304DC
MFKKLLTVSLFLLSCGYIYSQQPFSFTIIDSAGTNSTLTIGESYFMQKFGMNVDSDSVVCKNNRYIFKGTLEHPTAVRIYFSNNKKYGRFNHFFFIEPGNQEIVIKNGEKGLFVASRPATKIENEYQSFLQFVNSDNADAVLEPKLLVSYIQKYPSSYIGLFKLIDQSLMSGFSKEFTAVKTLFSSEIVKTKEYKYFENRYLRQLNLKTLSVVNSEKTKIKIDLSNTEAKHTLLVIWFNDCLPCIHEMKQLVQLNHNSEFSKKIRIIHISVDSLKFINENRTTLKKYGVSWKNYWDVNGEQLKKYIILDSYPSSLLLDNRANVVAQNIDPEEILEYISSGNISLE